MKKYSILFLLSLIFVLASCDNENVGAIYDDGGVTKYAFASAKHNVEMVVEQAGVIAVPVYRTTTKGASNVSVSLDASATVASVFRLDNSNVTFKDGEGVAYVNLLYPDIETVSPTASFTFKLAIADSAIVSPTFINEVEIKAGRKLTYEAFGVGVFDSKFFKEAWDQPILKAKEGEVYKLPGLYFNNYDIVFAINPDNTVSFEKQPTGYVHSLGMVSFHPRTKEVGGEPILSTKEGKVVTLNARFSIPDDRAFGIFSEVLTLP